MPDPVSNKPDMYRRLVAGEFGNTAPVWFTLDSWWGYAGHRPHSTWGVRSIVPHGDRRYRLNLKRDDVVDYVQREAKFAPGEFNLTEMVDQWAALKGVAYRSGTAPVGLHLTYVPGKFRHVPWREAFADPAYVRTAVNSSALYILQDCLWQEDYDWLAHLLDEYDDHVVEFTACDRAVGTVPGRNTLIWEVRKY